MSEEAAIKQQLSWSVRPDQENATKHFLHCLERDETGSVIQEMHRYICEHYQAGNEAQAADHRSTFRGSRGRVCWRGCRCGSADKWTLRPGLLQEIWSSFQT